MRIIARTDTKTVHFSLSHQVVAIENVNTIDERISKIDKTGFSIVICRPIGNRKHRFLRLSSAFVDCKERFQLPPTRYV